MSYTTIKLPDGEFADDKLCHNCKHCRTSSVREFDRCAVVFSLVDGLPALCTAARSGDCGRIGRYFEEGRSMPKELSPLID